jgi:hypothetical protein
VLVAAFPVPAFGTSRLHQIAATIALACLALLRREELSRR